MPIRISNTNGVMNHKGERYFLRAGQTTIDSDHPLVRAYPAMFDDPAEKPTYAMPVAKVVKVEAPKPEPTPEVKGEVAKVDTDAPKGITTKSVATVTNSGKVKK